MAGGQCRCAGEKIQTRPRGRQARFGLPRGRWNRERRVLVQAARIFLLLLLVTAPAIGQTLGVGPGGPVERSKWNGYDRLDFTVAGRPCILVVPSASGPERKWIWRTEFFDHEP